MWTDLTADQLEGAAFVAQRKVAMLADKIGFGKTAQIVRAWELIGAERITIICPPILKSNWLREVDKWSIFGAGAYRCTILRKGSDKVPEGPGIVIASYSLIAPRYRTDDRGQKVLIPGSDRIFNLLRSRGCDVLVLDEAHAVKSPGSERSKSIFRAHGIASSAARTWFVTGTPTPNNAAEAYVFASHAGAFEGSYERFKLKYCVEIETDYGTRIIGNRNEALYLAMMAPYVIGRNKVDPERAPLEIDDMAIDGTVPAELREMSTTDLEAIKQAADAGDWKLLSGVAVTTVRRLAGAAKAPAAAELIADELAGGVPKSLAYCSFTHTIETIAAGVSKRGFKVGVINGATSGAMRERLLSEFQDPRSDLRVLVCHFRAAGEGLTLTEASRVYMVEPSWNPEDNNQCIARAWRRGQRKTVRASFLYLPGSIDEHVSHTLTRKLSEGAKIRLSRDV